LLLFFFHCYQKRRPEILFCFSINLLALIEFSEVQATQTIELEFLPALVTCETGDQTEMQYQKKHPAFLQDAFFNYT
jgi:hypothetical protein